LALLAASCAPPSTRLAGRVVREGLPLPGASGTLAAASGPVQEQVRADADGVYRFPPVPAGTYYLTARAETAGRILGATAGKNPLHLAAGDNPWIGLQAVPWEEPSFQPMAAGGVAGFGALAGTVRFQSAPVAGAIVNLYLDQAEGLRGPGVRQSFPTGSDGRYALEEVPDGVYFVVARRRQTGGAAGPLREGDLYGAALANPVPIREHQETRLDLHLVRKERDDDPAAELLTQSGTGLRGRVVDEAGVPRAGVYVFAYRSRVVGHGMPDFLTLPTGPDGAFALPLGEGGLFYIGARERAGGSPAPGELFGFYEGSPDHGIEVPKGRIVDGVEIVVRRVLE